MPRLPDRPAVVPESEPVERETPSAPSPRTDSTSETENSVPESLPADSDAGDDGGTTEMFFIHTDHLNTPRVVTDEQQKKVWEWENTDPFGNNAPDENPEGQGEFAFNLRFPGQYHDMETGLHYNFHRDYDPGIGRYVLSDPIGLEGGSNLYLYTFNNPINYIDPDGKIFLGPVGFAGIAAGAITGGIGSLLAQLAQNNGNINCVKIENILWSMLTGGIAGLMLTTPLGSTWRGILSTGAVTNMMNYALSNPSSSYSLNGFLAAALSGAIGLALGGIIKPYMFARLRPDKSDMELVKKIALGSFFENVLGGTIGGYDYLSGLPESKQCSPCGSSGN